MTKNGPELVTELVTLGARQVNSPRDFNLFLPSAQWLTAFAHWLVGEFAGKKWTAEKFDCDDFAIRAIDRATESLWKADNLTNCGHAFAYAEVWHSTLGRHAVNIVRCEDEWKFLEPQNGEITPASVALADGGSIRSLYWVWL